VAASQRQQTLGLRKVNQFISKGLTTLKIPHSVPPCVCVCVCGHGYGCTQLHMHMEARSQLWMAIPRCCLPCFFRQNLSVTWNSPNRLGCLTSKAQRPTCLHMSLSPQICNYKHELFGAQLSPAARPKGLSAPVCHRDKGLVPRG
jgi:hypothetical protein